MMEQKDNKASAQGAKLEITARITLPDGRVIEKVVEAPDGIPSLDEYDMSDTDKFLATYDRYERSVIDVRDRLTRVVTQAISDYLKKTPDAKQGARGTR